MLLVAEEITDKLSVGYMRADQLSKRDLRLQLLCIVGTEWLGKGGFEIRKGGVVGRVCKGETKE